MREPLVTNEKQETVQHTKDLETLQVSKQIADGAIVPDTDVMLIKKSIVTGTPSMLVDEVFHIINLAYLT